MIDSKTITAKVEEMQNNFGDDEVVGKMLLILGKIEGSPIDEIPTDLLVNQVFTLCKIMDNLSSLKEYAYVRAEALGEEYKSKVRDEYLRIKNSGEKITDGMAKALAEQKHDSVKEEELIAVYQSRRLKELYDNTGRLINYTQTKIKSMDDSRIRHNIPNN